VGVDAVDGDRDLLGRERLVLQLAEVRAVERVGADGAEALDVEQRRALADLLVGREAHAQRGAREFRVRGQMGDGGHDLGHAGLVVGAEQRVAAGGDDVVPRGRVHHRIAARQPDRCAVVIAVHERLDARAGRVRARVHVGDQADHGTVTGQRRGHVAVLVQRGVGQARRAQLVHQQPREVELAGRARALHAVPARLRVDAHVAQEALEHVRRERLR
jgi:hypothetical protein